MTGPTSHTRIRPLEQPGRKRLGDPGDVETLGELTLGMLVCGLDEMGEGLAERALELEDIRRGFFERHHAIGLLNDITVTGVEIDHGDLGMLGREHPVKGL